MFWIVVLSVLILYGVGLATSVAMGGYIAVLLATSVVVVIVQLVLRPKTP